jgi:hypothetical protein
MSGGHGAFQNGMKLEPTKKVIHSTCPELLSTRSLRYARSQEAVDRMCQGIEKNVMIHGCQTTRQKSDQAFLICVLSVDACLDVVYSDVAGEGVETMGLLCCPHYLLGGWVRHGVNDKSGRR